MNLLDIDELAVWGDWDATVGGRGRCEGNFLGEAVMIVSLRVQDMGRAEVDDLRAEEGLEALSHAFPDSIFDDGNVSIYLSWLLPWSSPCALHLVLRVFSVGIVECESVICRSLSVGCGVAAVGWGGVGGAAGRERSVAERR